MNGQRNTPGARQAVARKCMLLLRDAGLPDSEIAAWWFTGRDVLAGRCPARVLVDGGAWRLVELAFDDARELLGELLEVTA